MWIYRCYSYYELHNNTYETKMKVLYWRTSHITRIEEIIGNLLSKTNRIHFNNDRVYFYPILFCVYM